MGKSNKKAQKPCPNGAANVMAGGDMLSIYNKIADLSKEELVYLKQQIQDKQ